MDFSIRGRAGAGLGDTTVVGAKAGDTLSIGACELCVEEMDGLRVARLKV